MTAPYRYDPTRTQQGVQAAVAQSEWGQFHKDQQALVEEMLKSLGDFGSTFGITKPTDEIAPAVALDSTQASQMARQHADLVARAQFWNIPGAEGMTADDLQRAIAAKRSGQKQLPAGSLEAYALALGASAVNAGSGIADLAGNLFGNLDKIPFLHSTLSTVMNTERSKQWLYDLASKTSEDVQLIRAQMPEEDKQAYDFTTAAGKVAGYALAAWAGWEGLGTIGGALPKMGWLGQAGSPLARAAIKGGIAGGLLGDPEGDVAKNVGLGAVLGAASIFGPLAPLATGAAGGALGQQFGAELPGTPAERRANEIKYGLGGAALGLIAPFAAQGLLKARASFRTPLDDAARSTFGAIPVDQTQAPGAPGEVMADYEIQGQPRPVGQGSVGGALGPAEIDALMHQTPSSEMLPGGEVRQAAEVQPTQGLGQPQVRALLPSTTTPGPVESQLGSIYKTFADGGLTDRADVFFQKMQGEKQVAREQLAQTFLDPTRVASGRLLGSQVAGPDGMPKVVYHGTGVDFEEFDPTKANPEGLYGPAYYNTEDPAVASTPGYAGGAAPQVRPSLLNIKNAFDADRVFGIDEATRLIDELAQKNPGYDWSQPRAEVTRGATFYNGGEGSPSQPSSLAGRELYLTLADTPLIAPPQGPVQELGNWLTIPPGPTKLGKAGLNQALQSVGYDGITHIGGGITGNVPHRVWAALQPEQVYSPYIIKALDAQAAAQTAHGLTKQATILESSTLPTAASKAEMTDADVVDALKANNPGGVSVLKGVGKPLDLYNVHPDVHFVQRDLGNQYEVDRFLKTGAKIETQRVTVTPSAQEPGKWQVTNWRNTTEGQIAIGHLTFTSQGEAAAAARAGGIAGPAEGGIKVRSLAGTRTDALVNATPAQAAQYEQTGLFENQRVTLPDGQDGKLVGHAGQSVTVELANGHNLEVPIDDVLPSKYGTPQADVPDLWSKFKTQFLSHLNYEAEQAGMSRVESIFDPRASSLMQQRVSDFLDGQDINDPAARHTIDADFNAHYVQEARALDPEMRDLQDKVLASAMDVANERARSSEPLASSMEEKAQAKGFVWLTEPGKGAGTLRDILNPDAAFDVPVESQHAGEEFLRNIDRAAPDLNPADAIPGEVARKAPQADNLDPDLNVGDHADLLASHVQDLRNGEVFDEADFSGFDEGGGAGQPPAPPSAHAPTGGLLPEGDETLGQQFQRLRKDDPGRFDVLRDMAKGGQLRYTRYLMAKFERVLEDAGVPMGRTWENYERVETNRSTANFEARPWLDEYGQIMREFDPRLQRDGTVVRIHAMDSAQERDLNWQQLADRGYSQKEIDQFKSAENQLGDFFGRYFSWKGQTKGPIDERGVFRYINSVRAKQALGDPAAFQDDGWLQPGTAYFADFAKEGNLQLRSLDARELGNYIVRAGMFDEYESKDFNTIWKQWGERGVPPEYTKLMRGHLRAMKYGYDPSGDLVVRGVQSVMKSVFNTPVTGREAARLANLPMSGMYRSMMAGHGSIFFRDAIQPLLGLAKVRAQIMTSVYLDALRGGPEIYSEMRQRGLQGGWITPDAPQIEGAGVFEAQPGAQADVLGQLTSEQAQHREILSRVGDIARSKAVEAIDRYTNSLNLYGKEQQLNRMIVGEAAHRQATAALDEYRRAELEAVMEKDPTLAQSYDDFADQSFFSSFERPIQRKLKELVDDGQDKEAANLFARQVADWSQHKFGQREQPRAVRGTFGRAMYMLGNFSGQFLESAYSAMSNGTPAQKSRFLGVVGLTSAALYEAKHLTGWAFDRWTWGNALKFSGSPMAQALADVVEATSGVIAKSEGYSGSQAQQGAIEDFFRSNPGLEVANSLNPFGGYIKSIGEYQAAQGGINPLEQAARYTVTGDRGSKIDLQRQEQHQVDSTLELTRQRTLQYQQGLQQRLGQPVAPAKPTHPGFGAIP